MHENKTGIFAPFRALTKKNQGPKNRHQGIVHVLLPRNISESMVHFHHITLIKQSKYLSNLDTRV